MCFKKILLSLTAVVFCVSCGTGASNGSISCPIPAAEATVNVWPKGITDRELLSNSSYISKMIQHGSNSNLRSTLRKSESKETFGAISATDLRRMKSALSYREMNGCADVPDYLPYYSALPVIPL